MKAEMRNPEPVGAGIGAKNRGLGEKPYKNSTFINPLSQMTFDQLVHILRSNHRVPVGGVTPVFRQAAEGIVNGSLHRFFPYKSIKAHYFCQIGEIHGPIILCQYFDSVAESIHRGTGHAVIAPLDDRYFSSVLCHLHSQFPCSKLLVAVQDADCKDYFELWDTQPLFQRGPQDE